MSSLFDFVRCPLRDDCPMVPLQLFNKFLGRPMRLLLHPYYVMLIHVYVNCLFRHVSCAFFMAINKSDNHITLCTYLFFAIFFTNHTHFLPFWSIQIYLWTFGQFQKSTEQSTLIFLKSIYLSTFIDLSCLLVD